jgi:hypothetical protein
VAGAAEAPGRRSLRGRHLGELRRIVINEMNCINYNVMYLIELNTMQLLALIAIQLGGYLGELLLRRGPAPPARLREGRRHSALQAPRHLSSGRENYTT